MPDILFQFRLDYNNEIVIYNVNPQHRVRGNPNKSIWVVTPEVEYSCFKFTYEKGWVDDNEAWGFLTQDNKKLLLLGIGQDDEELKLAKFRKDPNSAEWHGYPCNYMAKSQDVPSCKVMIEWVKKKFITKAKMNKIQHQLVCNL